MAGWLVDDRGKRVPTFGRHGHSAEGREPRYAALPWFLLFMAALSAAPAVWQLQRPGSASVIIVLLPVAYAIGGLVGLRANRRARRHPPAPVAPDRCPACGYSLAGLPLALDGCVVCPECAAAWRVAYARRRADP